VHTFALLFGIALGAYLAVFETWALTAREPLANTVTRTRFYKASLAALLISAATTPFLYIGTTFTLLFLLGFSVHVLLAFALWYRARPDGVQAKRWMRAKTAMGFGLLVLTVLDAKLLVGRNITIPIVDQAVTNILTVLVIPLLVPGIPQALRDWKAGGFLSIFDTKARYLGAVPLLCLLGLYGSFVAYLKLPGAQAAASQAYAMYASFIVITLVALLIDYVRPASVGSTMPVLAGLCLTTRLFTSAMVGATVFIAAWKLGVSISGALGASVPLLLTALGGFGLNDYFDVERDRINKPHRGIPSGRLTRHGVRTLALVLLVASLGVTLVSDLQPVQRVLHMLTLLGMVLYNFIVQRFGTVKGVYTAALSMVPFVFVIVSWSQMSTWMWFLTSVFLFMCGRELLMDVNDVAGDMRGGGKTLPMVVGERSAVILAIGLQLSAVLILTVWAVATGPPLAGPLGWVSLVSVCILTGLWIGCKGVGRRRVVNALMWAPMSLAIAIFVVSIGGTTAQ